MDDRVGPEKRADMSVRSSAAPGEEKKKGKEEKAAEGKGRKGLGFGGWLYSSRKPPLQLGQMSSEVG